MDVERIGAHGLHRGEHDREVLGAASRQNGVDGHLLHGAPGVVGRHNRDDLIRSAARALEHAEHPLGGGRHHRQPVAPAARGAGLDRVLLISDRDAPGAEARGSLAGGQALRGPGLERS